jgi:nucleotide-binding universal stress UspA family protein
MAISSMLVPVGGDERDELVLRYVCGLSVQSVRKLLVATAVESSGMEAPVIAAEVDRARESLNAMVAPFSECAMQIEVRVVTGNSSEAMLALARQADVDVICCGTEGKSFVDYLFSGSTSEDIFSSGKVRTMTVRYDLLEAAEDPRQLAKDFARRIVVPTDFSASSMRALLSVFDRPADAIDTLYVLHVIPPATTNLEATPSPEEWTARKRAEAEAKMEDIAAMAEDHGVKCSCEIREGDAGDVIVGFLNDVDATGVITGQRGRGRLSQVVLGGVSMRLLREAPCPVVVQP